ncbi:ATPase [Thermodesulfitimonas autotrophica]|uniref:ATPase n=1 Tax=Thermodesulfitimonas autotrophica TaxID=1894989 RepID=UPI002FE0C0E6
MELLSVINELEELVESSSRVPLTRKVLIDEEKILDILDRIRTILPDDVRKAKWVVQEREKVIEEARKEAERIIGEARREAEKRAEESEVVRQAKEMAEQILGKAEQVAREMKLGAREYADEILARLEERLNRITKEIQQGRAELKGMNK